MAERKKVSQAIRRRISKAMKGNKNAEKWTEDVVTKVLNSMIKFATAEYEIETSSTEESGFSSKGPNEKNIKKKAKRKVHLKQTLLVEYEIWNAKWFAQMREKFHDSDSVSYLLDAIDMICVSNTYNDAANGAINPAVAKMNLSTHYKWSDSIKQDIKQDVTGSVDFSLPEPSEEAMKAWKKANEQQEDAKD